jgi:SOS response regulatory protein OraA/RecX
LARETLCSLNGLCGARPITPNPPRLTALQRARPGFVLLVVNGEPWRTVPDDVVVRCALRADLELDRPLLRNLRRELRHAHAIAVAGRTLRRRDVSTKRLAERLAHAGVPPAAGSSAVRALREARILDDARVAGARARALAERGWGDAAIAARLEAEGIGEDDARAAIGTLPPEAVRAADIAARVPDRRKAWALLARRGFDESIIEGVVGEWTEESGAG